MAEKKMTKMEWFCVIEGIVAASNYKDKESALNFIAHEKELLNKKSGKAKESKTQEGHAAILAAIMEVLSERTEPVTIGEMMKDPRLESYEEKTKDSVKTVVMTNQKLSSMLKKLTDTDKIVKTYKKKVAYFSLSAGENEN